MYTYHHLISRLTEGDKIHLLTDLHSLRTPWAESLGLPRVNCAHLKDGCRGDHPRDLPTPALLARSWDLSLMKETAAELTRRLAESGVNHVFLPPAASAITPDGNRLSEDPHLSGKLAGALLSGTKAAGLTATATGYGFTEADATAMDQPPSRRFLSDHVAAPSAAMAYSGQLTAILVENNTAAHESMAEGGYFVLRPTADATETVTALTKGELLIHGSADALKAALHTHRRLKTAIAHGKASTGELEAAIQCGEAMSEETLDSAVDRLLTFAHAVAEGVTVFAPATPADTAPADTEIPTDPDIPMETDTVSSTEPDIPVETDAESPTEPVEEPTESPADNTPAAPPVTPSFDTATAVMPTPDPAADPLYKRALDGATVLLENRDRLLPLTKATRICILGDAAREGEDVTALVSALNNHGHTYLGYARGYDPALTRDDALTAEAAALAAEADTVLLFLATEAGKRTLPAAQKALLDRVTRLRKKTVVILSAAISPDMSFLRVATTPVAGLLLIPAGVKGAALHAVETLLGDRTPMGRLTETLTDSTHPACDRRGYKIGPFVGYRYYDTLGQGAVYPFGHGLGYTKFSYSSLRVREGEITFTVKNTGKRGGVAIPQVYAGIRSSAILRPKRELVAFTRLYLAPGEKTTVTLPWSPPPADGGMGLCEKGTYRLFLGESVSDIRMTADLPAGRDTVPPDGAKLSDYLPTVTNIPTENYVLEAATKPMKPSVRNLIFGIAAITLAVSVKLYDILTVSNSLFLNIVAILLAAGAVAFFVMEIADRKRGFARERAALEEANAALFAEAAEIPVPSADALFAAAAESAAAAEEEAAAEEQDHFLDVNKDLTLPVAVTALTTLATEKGLTPESGTVPALLSAMASSRLLLTRGMDSETFTAMTETLCEYFGCPAAVDTVDATYTDEAALLYRREESGELTPRNALTAVESARRDPRTVHLVSLTEVPLETLSDYFVPYARYTRAPRTACSVTTHDPEGNEVAYLLPENLWFVLNLKDGESLGNLPDYIAEVAALLNPAFTATPPAAAHSEFAPFPYGQMLYLCDRLKSGFALEEENWKRIDRLEAYAARYSGFAVTNKLWLGLETYLAALMTVEPDPAAALDEALSVRLLPALIAALSGKLPREERSLTETLEAVLGEGNATHCRRTLKESGADLT